MASNHHLLRPLGVLTFFVSLPIIEESLMAAGAFVQEGDWLRTIISSVGAVSGFLLLASGAVLSAKRRFGQTFAYWGAAGSIAAHTFGAVIGLVGGHGVLYGVGFPVAILLLFRSTPSNGVRPAPGDERDSATSPSSHHHGLESISGDIMPRSIVLCLASLAVVAGLTSTLMRAQAPAQVPPPSTSQAPPSDARVLSGADIGFRVESVSRTGEPVGTLVIRVNGAWVPVRFTPDILPRPAH